MSVVIQPSWLPNPINVIINFTKLFYFNVYDVLVNFHVSDKNVEEILVSVHYG